MSAGEASTIERAALGWPPSGTAMGELFARWHDEPGGGDRRAAWYAQVSVRTARRWRDPSRAASAIPFAAWVLLARASGSAVRTPPIETILPGPSSRDAFALAARLRLEEAMSSVLLRRRWRPAPDLVASLVVGPDREICEGRGVRATARALRVEPSTVLRWIDADRSTSAVPYAAWVMLLTRERPSTLGHAVAAPEPLVTRERGACAPVRI